MARYVLRAGGAGRRAPPGTRWPPGATIATLLPLTNTSAAPGLDTWDPGHWNGRRLAGSSRLEAIELVTAFGHGRHTCPAQPFSLSAMTTAASPVSWLPTSSIPAGRPTHSGPGPDRRSGPLGGAVPARVRAENGRSLP